MCKTWMSLPLLSLFLVGCPKDDGPVCGDGVLEAAEVCDGSALGAETCFTRAGHLHGALACGEGCAAFDTSGCHTCGNGVLEGPEDCDEDELNQRTCLDLGFSGGQLGCSSSCRYDTSGCTTLCGNGRLEAGETCDGTDLGGQTCEDLSLPSGELRCSVTCEWDTEQCTGLATCGNGACEPAEGEDATTCPVDCAPLECPPVQPGEGICVSGVATFFIDPVTDALLTSPIADPAAAADATWIEVRVYDPLVVASVGPGATPLATVEVEPRTGRFRILGLIPPTTGFIGLAVEDWSGLPAADDFARAVTFMAASGQENLEGVRAYGVTRGAEDQWSTSVGPAGLESAGCQPGQDFEACGTFIMVFASVDALGLPVPIPGVAPLSGPSPIAISRVFYLQAGGSLLQPEIDSESYTGETGTALIAPSGLGNYSGGCADQTPDSACETAGYTWPGAQLGGGIPGFFTLSVFHPLAP